MKRLIILLSTWINQNQKVLGLLLMLLALIRFFHLNYLNWDHGELCTGHGGIQYGYDYRLYLADARLLASGLAVSWDHLLCIGYSAFIAFFYTMGLGLEYVLLAQIIIALLAAFAAFDLGRIITGNSLAGVLCTLLMLVNPFIVQWHLFIHTESLYPSMFVISCWFILKAYLGRSVKYIVPAVIVTVYSIFIRPSGFIMIPGFIIFILFFSKILPWKKIGILALAMIAFAIIISSKWGTFAMDYYRVFEMSEKGRVIAEIPGSGESENDAANSNGGNVVHRDGSPTILKYSVLGLKRIAAELFPLYRSYVSVEFVLRFLFWMLPLYLMTGVGLFFLIRNKGYALLCFMLFFHLILIGFVYADREFRYLTHVLPLFVILGVGGLYSTLRAIRNHFSNQSSQA